MGFRSAPGEPIHEPLFTARRRTCSHSHLGSRCRLLAHKSVHTVHDAFSDVACIERIWLRRRQPLARIAMAQRPTQCKKFGSDDVRPRCPNRFRLVALGRLQHPCLGERLAGQRGQRRRQKLTPWVSPGENRLWHRRLRRRLPASGRSTAPLRVHRSRAGRRTHHSSSRRVSRHGWLSDSFPSHCRRDITNHARSMNAVQGNHS